MTRKERLMKTLRGEAVDRPAVNFYELNGLTQKQNDPDPYNIYSDRTWKPLLDLTIEKTDRIVISGIWDYCQMGETETKVVRDEWRDDQNRLFVKQTIEAPSRTLTSLVRRDTDVDTVWTTEHLLKDVDDFKAWLEIPAPEFIGLKNIDQMEKMEGELGDSGIVMLDTNDPLCAIAALFDMAEYTIIAMMENDLMRQALDKVAATLYSKVEAVAKAFPGRLWRIHGPEYASPPYLPPHLFKEYAADYVKPMVDIIHQHGGYARIHSHGNLKIILDHIVGTGCDALDPVEPSPQGDVDLAYVRQNYGEQLVLFGNLEIADIENMATEKFVQKVDIAIEEGMAGEGRGFVLMPSAAPYGRKLSPQTMRNYECIIERIENL